MVHCQRRGCYRSASPSGEERQSEREAEEGPRTSGALERMEGGDVGIGWDVDVESDEWGRWEWWGVLMMCVDNVSMIPISDLFRVHGVKGCSVIEAVWGLLNSIQQLEVQLEGI